MKAIKAIVVGRHKPTGGEGIEIIGNEDKNGIPQPRPIMFPATAEGCKPLLGQLLTEASETDCCLLFQAIPAQLAVAIAWMASKKIGAIVNIPGPRLTAVSREFYSDAGDGVGTIAAAVEFANPRAKLTVSDGRQVLTVSIDPFSPFVFSHVQWFNGSCSNWSLRGFLARFGLPVCWVEDGDIFINQDDSGEFPEINDGDEVCVSSDDILIEDNGISIRAVATPSNFKERFNATMSGEKALDRFAFIKTINEVKEFEGGG